MPPDFLDAIKSYLDQDGLIGSSPNPTKWSSGNPLLETAIACVIETRLNGRAADIDFLKARQSALAACRDEKTGCFNKNPGRPDRVTHDDLKALSAVSRICGMPFSKDLALLGKKTHWVFSNTGSFYWDALVKPWDKAFYLIAAGELCPFLNSFSLELAVLADARWGDPSSNRITWLVSEAVGRVTSSLDLAFSFWREKMKYRYDTVGGMMLAFYGGDGSDFARSEAARIHPHSRYGKLLSF